MRQIVVVLLIVLVLFSGVMMTGCSVKTTGGSLINDSPGNTQGNTPDNTNNAPMPPALPNE